MTVKKFTTSVCQVLAKFSRMAVFGMMLTATNSWADSVDQPTIAIIIDDMGNHLKTGNQLIDMPYPLTLAFLPHRKHTSELARKAHRLNKEIMLHIPMANTLGLDLGPGGLTVGMKKADLTHTLRKAIQSIPYVQGVNNHMGSALTQRRVEMSWVMEEIYHYPLYFVDSRTIASSVAIDTAQKNHIPSLSRDVFLDHWQTRKSIHNQFNRLIDVAKKKGTAIAIGHPHKVTTDYLEWALPKLDQEGIRIATVSALWAIRHNGQTMFSDRRKESSTPAFAAANNQRHKHHKSENNL